MSRRTTGEKERRVLGKSLTNVSFGRKKWEKGAAPEQKLLTMAWLERGLTWGNQELLLKE